jgi:hypothetical protein
VPPNGPAQVDLQLLLDQKLCIIPAFSSSDFNHDLFHDFLLSHHCQPGVHQTLDSVILPINPSVIDHQMVQIPYLNPKFVYVPPTGPAADAPAKTRLAMPAFAAGVGHRTLFCVLVGGYRKGFVETSMIFKPPLNDAPRAADPGATIHECLQLRALPA